MIRTLAIGALTCATPLFAQDFSFQIDGNASSSTVDVVAGLALPGSLIGSFDATENPTGTQTLPGLFGGSGNQPISVDLGLGIDSLFRGSIQGSFDLGVDEAALSAELSGLDLDLLGGETAQADLVLSLLFETFHTAQPASLYIGGFPLDLPLASQSLSDLILSQTGDVATGVMVPTGSVGEFDVLLILPLELSFQLDFAGQVTPVGPVPLPLPATLRLNLNGGQQPTVQFDLSFQGMQSLPDPVPGFTIDDVPLPLPTLLPPGDTANLLLNAAIGSLDFDLALEVDIVASGEGQGGFTNYCTSVPNSTGEAATLTGMGSPSLTAANLGFTVSGLPTGEPCMLFMSQTQAFQPNFFGGTGNLCIGTPMVRFGRLIVHSDRDGVVVYAIDVNNLPMNTVFQPGESWNFQAWYRDGSPERTHNLSDAVTVDLTL